MCVNFLSNLTDDFLDKEINKNKRPSKTIK